MKPKIKALSWGYHVDNMSPLDLQQELYLVVCLAIKKYNKSRGSLSTYLWRCLINQCITLQNRRKLSSTRLYNNYNMPDGDKLQTNADTELTDLEVIIGTKEYEILKAKYIDKCTSEELRKRFHPKSTLYASRVRINLITKKYKEIFKGRY